MRILAIESSCDETCAAIVEDGWKVLANVIASSLDLHKKTGGVVPEVAARAHTEAIIPVIGETLNRAFPGKDRKEQIELIDKIAVANEPGLLPAILVGTETAKWLSYLWSKPISYVNHVQGHVYANWLDRDPAMEKIEFPLICLSVSGGHNELILMMKPGDFELLGETQDDAAGEAFDKVARLLGLGYPGGPLIEKAASKFKIPSPKIKINSKFKTQNSKFGNLRFPRAWLNQNQSDKWDGTSYNFSFSGLKSEVLREVERRGELSESDQIEISYAFQEAVFDVLVTKLLGAARKFRIKEIHISGGVSANKRFRELIEAGIPPRPCLSAGRRAGRNHEAGIGFRFPQKMSYCTDNAAMIGAAAYFNS